MMPCTRDWHRSCGAGFNRFEVNSIAGRAGIVVADSPAGLGDAVLKAIKR